MRLVRSDLPVLQLNISQRIYTLDVEALEPGSFFIGQIIFIVWDLGDANYLLEQSIDFYCNLPSWLVYILKYSVVSFVPETPAYNFGKLHPTGLQTFFVSELSRVKAVPA